MNKHIKILTITFDTEISPHEIPLFRGNVISTIGRGADVLFHNHTDAGFRNSYPLIQYKRIGKNPCIVCVDEGTDIIGQYLQMFTGKLEIGDKVIETKIQSVVPQRVLVQLWEGKFRYSLRRWLPLNSKNYTKYNTAEGAIERISILQDILKGNILSMLKGLGIFLDSELKVEITDVPESFDIVTKGIKMIAFNAEFTTNISLPDNIGLGKNASIGFGVIREVKPKDNNKQTDNTNTQQ